MGEVVREMNGGKTNGRDERPSFLVTIDTEGDNCWARPRESTTRNAGYLPRFQALCERYGLKPTWLTNYEMALCPTFREFGRDVLRRGAGEIGMHLHAWNSPPIVPLTDDDSRIQPYLIEYPLAVMREKIVYLTDLLASTFACNIGSHRAGRWGLDRNYARLLIEAGFRSDCSVTPHVSWSAYPRGPSGRGGCDFRTFPSHPYLLDLERLNRPGNSGLLEVPMTIRPRRLGRLASRAARLANRESRGVLARIGRYVFPTVAWLRPDGRNLHGMLELLRQIAAERAPYAQFMLHSSELMPGGSPRFSTARSIERLYGHLEPLFEAAARAFRGKTLAEFSRESLDRAGDAASAERLDRTEQDLMRLPAAGY